MPGREAGVPLANPKANTGGSRLAQSPRPTRSYASLPGSSYVMVTSAGVRTYISEEGHAWQAATVPPGPRPPPERRRQELGEAHHQFAPRSAQG